MTDMGESAKQAWVAVFQAKGAEQRAYGRVTPKAGTTG